MVFILLMISSTSGYEGWDFHCVNSIAFCFISLIWLTHQLNTNE